MVLYRWKDVYKRQMYVISKNAAVDMIEHYYQEYGLKRFIFRLPTIYMYTPNKYYYVNGVKKIMGFRYMIAVSYTHLKLKSIHYIGTE